MARATKLARNHPRSLAYSVDFTIDGDDPDQDRRTMTLTISVMITTPAIMRYVRSGARWNAAISVTSEWFAIRLDRNTANHRFGNSGILNNEAQARPGRTNTKSSDNSPFT
jgi:hypothetical protein